MTRTGFRVLHVRLQEPRRLLADGEVARTLQLREAGVAVLREAAQGRVLVGGEGNVHGHARGGGPRRRPRRGAGRRGVSGIETNNIC